MICGSEQHYPSRQKAGEQHQEESQKTPSPMAFPMAFPQIITKKPILHLQVSTFIMKNMKFTRQKVIYKEGGIVKNE